MWTATGRKGLTREIECELCFEEKVLVSNDEVGIELLSP